MTKLFTLVLFLCSVTNATFVYVTTGIPSVDSTKTATHNAAYLTVGLFGADSVITAAEGCDSVDLTGFTDSVATQLIIAGTARCDNTDSLGVRICTDTLGTIDTVWTGVTLSNGDPFIDTMTGLIPSTKYFGSLIDSEHVTQWDSMYTADSANGGVLYFCALPVITSITDQDLRPDSGKANDTLIMTGTNLKTAGGSATLGDSALLAVDSSGTEWKFKIPAGMPDGIYWCTFVDSCNNRDSSQVRVWHLIPIYTRDTVIVCTVTGCGTVTVSPADMTVDSATACTTWATPATGDRCDSIVSVGSVSGRSATTADSVIHIADQDWIDSVFFDTIPAAPVPEYVLTVTHTGNGSTTGGGTVDSNAATAITATGTDSSHFVQWSVTAGTATITDPASASTTVRCHSNATVSAAFGLDTHYLSYTITGGNAAVTFLGDSIAAYGETITCTLTVLPGYVADWPGGHVGAGKSVLAVLMTKDSSLAIATHARPEYAVDTTWGSYLSAWTVTGGLTHDSGATVTMTATCDACSSFSGYTGDYTGSSSSASFMITGDMAIGAGCEYGTCASVNKRSPFGFLRSFRFGWR